MEGAEFRQRRERLRLTQNQVAQHLKVSTATVRNWESGVTPISAAVEMLWDVWKLRFRQEDPTFGPLTLIYTDGPMFIDPQGPRRPLAMMRQEPFLTNAAYVRSGPRLPATDEIHARQAAIAAQADRLDELAAADQPVNADNRPAEDRCDKLRALGVWPPDQLVSGLAAAYVARGMT